MTIYQECLTAYKAVSSCGKCEVKVEPPLHSTPLHSQLSGDCPRGQPTYAQCSPLRTNQNVRLREGEESHLLPSTCLSGFLRPSVNPSKSLRHPPQPYQDTDLKEKRKCSSFAPRNIIYHCLIVSSFPRSRHNRYNSLSVSQRGGAVLLAKL